MSTFHVSLDLPLSCTELLIQALKKSFKPQVQDCWISAIFSAISEIWRSHSQDIFDNKKDVSLEHQSFDQGIDFEGQVFRGP